MTGVLGSVLSDMAFFETASIRYTYSPIDPGLASQPRCCNINICQMALSSLHCLFTGSGWAEKQGWQPARGVISQGKQTSVRYSGPETNE